MSLDPLTAAFVAVEDNADLLRGPEGPQGVPGVPGTDGADGRDGQPGPQGVPGVNGHDGQDGAEGRPGRDGERGPKGDKGEKGDRGIQGPPGSSGRRGLPTYVARPGGGSGGPTPDLAAVLGQGADAAGHAITGLADPTNAQDAATKAYVDANAGGGGLGSAVAVDDDGVVTVNSPSAVEDGERMFQLRVALPDPGNTWSAEASVSGPDDRIKVTVEDALRVFEPALPGTTDVTEPAWNLSAGIGSTTPDGTAIWSYLGIVGEPDSEHPLFDVKTDGDADWYLDQDAGAGFRFNQSINGVLADAGVTQITTDGLKVYRTYDATDHSIDIRYDYGDQFLIFLNGLPTADPGEGYPGALWVDGDGFLRVSAGTAP